MGGLGVAGCYSPWDSKESDTTEVTVVYACIPLIYDKILFSIIYMNVCYINMYYFMINCI